ncbi:hypothetical protein OFC47_25425, partial [Escherichia coli]|nr:hypothetical protein [Escherichia coli]
MKNPPYITLEGHEMHLFEPYIPEYLTFIVCQTIIISLLIYKVFKGSPTRFGARITNVVGLDKAVRVVRYHQFGYSMAVDHIDGRAASLLYLTAG